MQHSADCVGRPFPVTIGLVRVKRWVRKLVGLGVLALIVLVLLEAMLLLSDPWIFRNAYWGFDSDLGFRVRPYAVYGKRRANEFGFNDRDYPLEREPGTTRILMLGDSFNWAGGRDWNYVGLLRHNLQERFGEGVEVINAGYPATHTGEQLRLLEKFGLRYRPDLVVLGFFAGNDFYDAQPWRERIAYGRLTIDVDKRREGYWTIFGQPLMLRSRFWMALKAWSAELRFARDSNRMSERRFLQLQYKRWQLANPEKEELYEPNVRLIFDSLRRMKQVVRGAGAELVVAAFPDEYQVDLQARQQMLDRYEIDENSYRWTRPQDLLEEFCRGEGIEYHDLLPGFRRAAAETGLTLYIPRNTHWNRHGNRIAANLLTEILSPRLEQAAPGPSNIEN